MSVWKHNISICKYKTISKKLHIILKVLFGRYGFRKVLTLHDTYKVILAKIQLIRNQQIKKQQVQEKYTP